MTDKQLINKYGEKLYIGLFMAIMGVGIAAFAYWGFFFSPNSHNNPDGVGIAFMVIFGLLAVFGICMMITGIRDRINAAATLRYGREYTAEILPDPSYQFLENSKNPRTHFYIYYRYEGENKKLIKRHSPTMYTRAQYDYLQALGKVRTLIHNNFAVIIEKVDFSAAELNERMNTVRAESEREQAEKAEQYMVHAKKIYEQTKRLRTGKEKIELIERHSKELDEDSWEWLSDQVSMDIEDIEMTAEEKEQDQKTADETRAKLAEEADYYTAKEILDNADISYRKYLELLEFIKLHCINSNASDIDYLAMVQGIKDDIDHCDTAIDIAKVCESYFPNLPKKHIPEMLKHAGEVLADFHYEDGDFDAVETRLNILWEKLN